VAGSHVLAQLLRRRLTLLTQMYRALNSPEEEAEEPDQVVRVIIYCFKPLDTY
jgi:hypothetical protein